MKKIAGIFLCLVVSISLIGCCTKTLPNGQLSRNPLNCVKPVVNTVDKTICPTLETGKEAVAAAGFLKAYPELYAAFLVFDNFSKGVCYLASQLNAALAAYDSAPLPAGMAKIGAQKPDVSAIRQAVK